MSRDLDLNGTLPFGTLQFSSDPDFVINDVLGGASVAGVVVVEGNTYPLVSGALQFDGPVPVCLRLDLSCVRLTEVSDRVAGWEVSGGHCQVKKWSATS